MLRPSQAYKMVQKEIEKIIIDEYEKKNTPVQDIADILNTIGYKTKLGKKFTNSIISNYAIDLGLNKRTVKKLGQKKDLQYINNNEIEINEIIINRYGTDVKIEYITRELNRKGYRSNTNNLFTNSIVSKTAKKLGLKPRHIRTLKRNINKIVGSECMNNMVLTEVKALETKEVSFNGQTLLGFIDESGRVYTNLKRVCENLGLAWNKQLHKIKGNEVLSEGMTEMVIATNSGNQKAIAYDIDYLPTWLLSIKANKVKEELKPMLIKYQREAVKVLRDAFINKQSVVVAPQKTLSLSEMLLAQAQLNVDLEKKLSQVNNQMLEVKNDVSQFKSEVSQVNSHVSVLDQKVNKILEQKEEGLKNLDCIEYSETLPLFKTERTKVRQLVNAYAGAFNCSPKEVWNKLYTEFYYRYKRNIKLLADNRNMKPLDFVESSGLMEDLYNLASNLLRV